MAVTTTQYICIQGACYHARPLTLMQEEVLYLCTYGASLPAICRDTWYPPVQVAGILDFLMRHGLVMQLPVATEPAPQAPSAPSSFPAKAPGLFSRLVHRTKQPYQHWIDPQQEKRGDILWQHA